MIDRFMQPHTILSADSGALQIRKQSDCPLL